MGKLYKFEKKKAKRVVESTGKPKPQIKLFEAISEMWGADFDKILFEGDEKESKKLDRAVRKENLRFMQNKEDR